MSAGPRPTGSLLALALTAIEHMITTLLYGMTGGLIDFSTYLPQLKESQQLMPMKDPIMLEPRRFEACTDCPKCGRLDYHLLRSPKPPPCDEEMRAWEGRRTTAEIHQWGNGVIRTVDTSPPPPVDESPFEVIRICQCGHEWGQL